MNDALHRVVRGAGPSLILVHGSASDADGWTGLFSHLTSRYRLVAYDRRGTDRSPLPEGTTSYGVEEHARDLLELAAEHDDGPAIVCGSSFGAVVALQAVRIDPDRFAGLILIEPPVPADDAAPAVPDRFMRELLRRARHESGQAAGDFFLEQVLTEKALAGMPERHRAHAASHFEQIIMDCRALQAHRVGFDSIERLRTPTLLVGGERSRPMYLGGLKALAERLPRSRLVIVPGAGHMVHTDEPRPFIAALDGFVSSLRTH